MYFGCIWVCPRITGALGCLLVLLLRQTTGNTDKPWMGGDISTCIFFSDRYPRPRSCLWDNYIRESLGHPRKVLAVPVGH